MKALLSPASPFARKVRVVIREAGLMPQVEEVLLKTSPLDSHPQLLAANPTGKLPVLLREDGPAIADSRVITRYLDHVSEAGLYPQGRLWEVLTLEALADGIMEAAVAMAYEQRFREEPMQSRDWLEAQWGKAARAIAALDDRWMSHLEGRLTAAQIAVACALAYVDFRHGDRDWRAQSPALAAWLAAFQERESMKQTAPE